MKVLYVDMLTSQVREAEETAYEQFGGRVLDRPHPA